MAVAKGARGAGSWSALYDRPHAAQVENTQYTAEVGHNTVASLVDKSPPRPRTAVLFPIHLPLVRVRPLSRRTRLQEPQPSKNRTLSCRRIHSPVRTRTRLIALRNFSSSAASPRLAGRGLELSHFRRCAPTKRVSSGERATAMSCARTILISCRQALRFFQLVLLLGVQDVEDRFFQLVPLLPAGPAS